MRIFSRNPQIMYPINKSPEVSRLWNSTFVSGFLDTAVKFLATSYGFKKNNEYMYIFS